MIVYPLFPIAVAKFELGREYTAEEIAFVDSQKTHKNQGNTTSNDHYVLRHDAMASLKAFVELSMAEYLRGIYEPKHEVGLRITQSWLNYCKPGEWHHKHNHANSFISGVLYVKAARERDKIYFYKDHASLIKLAAANYNPFSAESWWFEVNAGDLVLFPSHLTHSVETVQQDRISLSFNSFPVGYTGEENELTALHLKD